MVANVNQNNSFIENSKIQYSLYLVIRKFTFEMRLSLAFMEISIYYKINQLYTVNLKNGR